MEAAASTEINVLGWSVVLLIVHIAVQTLFVIKDAGLGFAMSNRDGVAPLSGVTRRLTMGIKNFVETYGVFVALALALVVTGKTGGLGATGAWVWLLARVVYVPVFAAGIPVARTLVWGVSIVGLLMMLARLWS